MIKQSDFERVLMNIAVDTSGTVHDIMERLSNGFSLRSRFGNFVPQFIPIELSEIIGMPITKGDIIRCRTNPNHHWGISVYISSCGNNKYILREIGGSEELLMNNESLDVLRFMNPSRLHTGHKYKLYQWALKAFTKRYNPNADYFKRCGGIEFKENELIIWSRAHVWQYKGIKNNQTTYAQPKKFILNWNNKTRLKDIVNAMNEQGFGDDFEYLPIEPTREHMGYYIVTKKDIEKTLAGNTKCF